MDVVPKRSRLLAVKGIREGQTSGFMTAAGNLNAKTTGSSRRAGRYNRKAEAREKWRSGSDRRDSSGHDHRLSAHPWILEKDVAALFGTRRNRFQIDSYRTVAQTMAVLAGPRSQLAADGWHLPRK